MGEVRSPGAEAARQRARVLEEKGIIAEAGVRSSRRKGGQREHRPNQVLGALFRAETERAMIDDSAKEEPEPRVKKAA